MSERGSILIVTLWVMALLALMAISVNVRARVGLRMEHWREQDRRAEELALTLAETWLLRVQADETPDFDGYTNPWLRPLTQSGDTLLSEFGGAHPGEFEYVLAVRVQDESGKLNINLAPVEVIRAALEGAGLGLDAADVANAIVDWRDADSAGLAENDFYAGQTPPYAPPNAEFVFLDELLYVRGVGAALYFGEDANRNGLLDPEEDDGTIRWPRDNEDGALQPGLRDIFTIYGDGSINVNTAPELVLSAVFKIALGPGEYEMPLRALLQARQGRDGVDGTDDDHPFETFDALRETLTDPVYTVLAQRGVELDIRSYGARAFCRVQFPPSAQIYEGELLVTRDDEGPIPVAWRSPLR